MVYGWWCGTKERVATGCLGYRTDSDGMINCSRVETIHQLRHLDDDSRTLARCVHACLESTFILDLLELWLHLAVTPTSQLTSKSENG